MVVHDMHACMVLFEDIHHRIDRRFAFLFDEGLPKHIGDLDLHIIDVEDQGPGSREIPFQIGRSYQSWHLGDVIQDIVFGGVMVTKGNHIHADIHQRLVIFVDQALAAGEVFAVSDDEIHAKGLHQFR